MSRVCTTVCFLCGEIGHYPMYCPTSTYGTRIKKRTRHSSIQQLHKASISSGSKDDYKAMAEPESLIQIPTELFADVEEAPEFLDSLSANARRLIIWARIRAKIRAIGVFHKSENPSSRHSDSVTSGDHKDQSSEGKQTADDQMNDSEKSLSNGKDKDHEDVGDDLQPRTLNQILLKKPEERTQEDLSYLQEITSRLKFFQNMPKTLHNDLCKVMRYEAVSAGDAVFRQGSIGMTFYVVLTGEVAVHVLSTEEEEAPEEESDVGNESEHEPESSVELSSPVRSTSRLSAKIEDLGATEHSTSTPGPQISTENSGTVSPQRLHPESAKKPPSRGLKSASSDRRSAQSKLQRAHAKRLRDYGRQVAVIGSGESFGELALLKDTPAPRVATIVAIENTELLTLHKEDYNRTLKQAQAQELEDKFNFLQRMAFFKHWDSKRLMKFMYFMRNTTVNSSEAIIAKQGDILNDIYFLYKGDCRIIYFVDVQNKPAISKDQEDCNEDDEEDSMSLFSFQYDDENLSSFSKEDIDQLNRDIHMPPAKHNAQKYIAQYKYKAKLDLAVVSRGETIGENCAIQGTPLPFTVVADNNTEFLVVNRTDFLRRCDAETKEKMMDLWAIKSEFFLSRILETTKLQPTSFPNKAYVQESILQLYPGAKKEDPEVLRQQAIQKELESTTTTHRIHRPQPPSAKKMQFLATPKHKRMVMKDQRANFRLLEQHFPNTYAERTVVDALQIENAGMEKKLTLPPIAEQHRMPLSARSRK